MSRLWCVGDTFFLTVVGREAATAGTRRPGSTRGWNRSRARNHPHSVRQWPEHSCPSTAWYRLTVSIDRETFENTSGEELADLAVVDRVLRFLVAHDDRAFERREIAARTEIDADTVATALDRLHERELVDHSGARRKPTPLGVRGSRHYRSPSTQRTRLLTPVQFKIVNNRCAPL